MLDNGTQLPPIQAKDLDGNPVTLADAVQGSWSVVIFYRGHW
jgi:peroxiredoxin